MSRARLPNSLPRASDFQRFSAEPLEFLAEARITHGNLFVIRDDGPVFSRDPDCAGVLAAFGMEQQRVVLSDIESFCLPMSAAQLLGLSQNLGKLNHSLHSMRGNSHTIQKRLLVGILDESETKDYHGLICTALHEFGGDWKIGSTVGLLSQMRDLTLQMSSRLLFGERYFENAKLTFLLRAYFELRREASSPTTSTGKDAREQLVAVGNSLYDGLQSYTRRCRRGRADSLGGLIARLATAGSKVEPAFSEDEVIGHGNVLYISSTEPIAIALTWILLILSQLPVRRSEIRNEVNAMLRGHDFPTISQLNQLPLLDGVIKEGLRLLPPNAFMVRTTTRPILLSGIQLPALSEVILCPFLAHRDIREFYRPTEFIPERWKEARPSPFVYFPFGAGGHSCAGRRLATYLIKMSLAFLLPRYDLILAGEQYIDWRLHIQFMPRSDPTVTIQSPDASGIQQAGKLVGPVAKMLVLVDQMRANID